ncbi:MAG TPA: hypothetical protein VFM15_04915 [Gammaproteobacteria bacterium]|nr:hypothetical protein [Gammaproteobacteria bacterium]
MSLKNWVKGITGNKAGDGSSAEFSGFVHDIDTAQCLFCPYGTSLQPGDRVTIHDEKTVFGRVPRHRLVEITVVKPFRTTGRVITVGSDMASENEVRQIAGDSEIAVDQLMTHRKGTATYDAARPPVVVYFQPVEAG